MESKKSWLRPTQLTKKFPSNKYGFSQNLKEIGDFVETFPMTFKECCTLQKAAHNWAWFHGVVATTRILRAGNGLYTIRVTLTAKVRVRDFK